ncbi:MAG: HAD family hydrolase [Alphaproteobacteria bacterium]
MEQRMQQAQAFFFDIENTMYDVIGPGIKATAYFLPAAAEKLGTSSDAFGLEIDRALRLQFDVAPNKVAHLTPSVIAKAGEAGYLDADEALKQLAEIYKASGNDVKEKIAAYDALYKKPVMEGFLAEESKTYDKIASPGLALYNHVLDLLRELRSRDFLVGFVSSKNASGIVHTISALGLDREVDFIVTAADNMNLAPVTDWTFTPTRIQAGLKAPHIVFPEAGMVKKHPAGLTNVAAALGVDMNRVVMTGDNPPEDVANTQKQGGIGVLAGWGDVREAMAPQQNYHWYYKSAITAGRSTVPDVTFADPSDFIEFVKSHGLKGDPALKEAALKQLDQLLAPSTHVKNKVKQNSMEPE